jgi:uncharacterized membrane protein YcaP (DUF421 family)
MANAKLKRAWGMTAVGTFLDSALGLSAAKAEELSTYQVCLRAATVFLVLVAYVRFGKKRFLGQATGFDAVLVIVIGSVASRAISGTAPFVASLAATFTLVVTHWVISYFTECSPALSYLVKGHDTVLIQDGRIDRRALKSAHMSGDDLAEDLRQNGISDATDVKEARLERSGKLSVIRK